MDNVPNRNPPDPGEALQAIDMPTPEQLRRKSRWTTSPTVTRRTPAERCKRMTCRHRSSSGGNRDGQRPQP